jgi:Fic family protein
MSEGDLMNDLDTFYKGVADLHRRDFTMEEIAYAYGVSVSTAKQYVSRARQRGFLESAEQTRARRSCPCCGATRARWKTDPYKET